MHKERESILKLYTALREIVAKTNDEFCRYDYRGKFLAIFHKPKDRETDAVLSNTGARFQVILTGASRSPCESQCTFLTQK